MFAVLARHGVCSKHVTYSIIIWQHTLANVNTWEEHRANES